MIDRDTNRLLALFFLVLVGGFFFHQSPTFAGSLAGHLVGMTGAAMMFLTLLYPFRKRVLGRRGRQNPISTHIFFGLAGPSLVVVHSGHKLDSLIGVLTFTAMLLVVLSGITGRFLFRSVSQTLKDQQRELATLKDSFRARRNDLSTCGIRDAPGHVQTAEDIDAPIERQADEAQKARCEQLVDLAESISQLEYTSLFFESTKSLFSKWMRVHHVLTIFLFAFIILHIVTVLYYGLRWAS